MRQKRQPPRGEAGMMKKTVETNQNELCDRRLSRAARSILHEKLLASPAAKKIENNADNKVNVWHLLDFLVNRQAMIDKDAAATSTTCPLLPQLDVWKNHEEHSAVISADSRVIPRQKKTGFTTARFARGYVHSQHPYWYKCLYCQKVFSSRYYLDLHQTTQHSSSSLSSEAATVTNSTTRICPATDWCNFLSPTACHHRALEEEPYYDRGSAGRRKDRYRVQAKLWKQANTIPCTVAAAQQARATCRAVGQSCFGQDNAMMNYWQERVCANLSCPNRLQQLYFRTLQDGDLVLRQVHEWQDDWLYWYEEHHALGWTGVLVLTLLGLYYTRVGYRKWQKYHRSRRAGPRLLRPKAKQQ